MGSCAAPSAKGDDKFITTDYLQQCQQKWIDDRAQEIIDSLPKEPSGLFRFSVPMDKSPYEGLRSDAAGEAYNDLISAVAYAQAEYDWDHRTGCPF
ncbi:host nuclease inhibitor GamL [Klebsiella pneumoniae]|uniref:host nuclease inhibitor GamL n=1 Tax=Klebsiella pneumoniae TaxID=573 RepID=UPI00398C843B